MRVITDLHLHSKWSRACSKYLTLSNLAHACERKGIQFLGTSDFTHPAWRKEIKRELLEVDVGTFTLKDGSSSTRFLLATEISCIYKRAHKVRRIHHLVLLSSLDAMERVCAQLERRGCNLKSDGRPIIGLDSEELLKIVLDVDALGLLIPAHAWTPWFGIFGSQSGFDTLEECFGEHASYIPAIETGLSSDPAMNARLSCLDRLFLVSNSDAHSLDKLGREANVFDMEQPKYAELHRILIQHDTSKFLETIEFFPEEGKYHVDGHRECAFWCHPEETKKRKGVCPICGKPLTIGVLHRVDDLADRGSVEGAREVTVPYRSIIPLAELLGSVYGVGSSAKKVVRKMETILSEGRTEFGVLLDLPPRELRHVMEEEAVEAVLAAREGRVSIHPGYDGVYGVIAPVLSRKNTEQTSLF